MQFPNIKSLSVNDEGIERLEIALSARGSFQTERKRLDIGEPTIDSHFFEADYNLATATGFSIWEGSWILLDCLSQYESQSLDLDNFLHTALHQQGKVLELGSGTGVTALGLACLGANVIATDVGSLVEGTLLPNITLNHTHLASKMTPPSHSKNFEPKNEGTDYATNTNQASETLSRFLRIGSQGGSVWGTALDWTVPLDRWQEDLKEELNQVWAILAVETIWLSELVEDLIRTIVSLLNRMNATQKRSCCAYLLFSERGKSDSEIFISAEKVLEKFGQYCSIDTIKRAEKTSSSLAWRFVKLSLK